MSARNILFVFTIQMFSMHLLAQNTSSRTDKVSHAEPLYMDLVRDLGARKGEKELNVGLSMEGHQDFHTMGGLVEYEFTPANRLGVEVEVPFEVNFKTDRHNKASMPQSSITGLKLATQYTFLVSKKHQLSLAVGYANDFEFHLQRNAGKFQWAPENVMYPFFVVAKGWKTNFHTLLYTGPSLGVDFRTGKLESSLIFNANFHYMFKGTKNFIGLEVDQEISSRGWDLVLRPQVRVAISKQMMLGFVTGIPVVSKNEGISMFCRLIYEPRGKAIGRKGSRH